MGIKEETTLICYDGFLKKRDWHLIIQCQLCGCLWSFGVTKKNINKEIIALSELIPESGECPSCLGKGKGNNKFLVLKEK